LLDKGDTIEENIDIAKQSESIAAVRSANAEVREIMVVVIIY